jgi:hypothetical protein
MNRFSVLVLAIGLVFSGCAQIPQKDLTRFREVNPTSILVVPAVNESVEVTAADYYLSTVPIPLAERGYYVFPVNLVKRILEDEGLSDASLVHSAATEKLCSLFGADSVLYVTIKEWNAQYLVLSTTVNVKMQYEIKDCLTGDILWEHEQRMTYTPQNNSTGNPIGDLLVMAVSAAVTKAAPDYLPLARQANAMTFNGRGIGIPLGPYAVGEENEQSGHGSTVSSSVAK